MPTVYTHKIDEGTLTNGKDFIKLCLNAFGIMIHNKDNAPTTERTDFNKVYASDIEYYTKQIAQAKEKLSKAFKKTDYKILIVAEENFKEENPKMLKIVVLLDKQEKIDFVKNSLTQTNVEYGILKDTIQENIISEFYANVREWTNTIQNYLANEFGFSGKTIVEASLYNEELQAFNITCSGKGTNDDIVWVMKEMSKAITLSKNCGFYINDKFSFVNGYFQR